MRSLRRKRYRELYFFHNPQSDPQHEVEKYKWPLEEKVISKVECATTLSEIPFQNKFRRREIIN